MCAHATPAAVWQHEQLKMTPLEARELRFDRFSLFLTGERTPDPTAPPPIRAQPPCPPARPPPAALNAPRSGARALDQPGTEARLRQRLQLPHGKQNRAPEGGGVQRNALLLDTTRPASAAAFTDCPTRRIPTLSRRNSTETHSDGSLLNDYRDDLDSFHKH